jgi:hypothetical protein
MTAQPEVSSPCITLAPAAEVNALTVLLSGQSRSSDQITA